MIAFSLFFSREGIFMLHQPSLQRFNSLSKIYQRTVVSGHNIEPTFHYIPPWSVPYQAFRYSIVILENYFSVVTILKFVLKDVKTSKHFGTTMALVRTFHPYNCTKIGDFEQILA